MKIKRIEGVYWVVSKDLISRIYAFESLSEAFEWMNWLKTN